MFLLDDKEKRFLTHSIDRLLKKTASITALTVSMIVPVTSFAQDSGCDTDSDCIVVVGDPDEDGGGIYIPPAWGSGNGGDDSGDGSGGSGGGSSGNPAECVAYHDRKPENCFQDPGPMFNSGPFVFQNYSSINGLMAVYDPPHGWVYKNDFEYLTYPDASAAISALSQSYYSSSDYSNARGVIWSILAPVCDRTYVTDKQHCLQEQADFMASIKPNGGNSYNWAGAIAYGPFIVTIGGSGSTANWVQTLLEKIDSQRLCRIWQQDPLRDRCGV